MSMLVTNPQPNVARSLPEAKGLTALQLFVRVSRMPGMHDVATPNHLDSWLAERLEKRGLVERVTGGWRPHPDAGQWWRGIGELSV